MDTFKSKPNNGGYIVIGAGLPRTGTASIQNALSILLDGPVYHMKEVRKNFANGFDDMEFWSEASQKQKSSKDWIEFFESRGYRAGVDFPPSLFYKELMEVFPDAKVILTIREPESWYKSVRETIYQLGINRNSFPENVLALMTQSNSKFSTMMNNLARQKNNRFNNGLYDAISEGKEASMVYFNDWVKDVKTTVPKEKLLVFSVKEGWEPLCKFLNVPVPNQPFPNINDSKEMKKYIKMNQFRAYSIIVGIPITLSICAYFIYKSIEINF